MIQKRYMPSYTAKETARLHSYQAGYSFGKLYYSGNPLLSKEQLQDVVSTLRPRNNMVSDDYKMGFITGYLIEQSHSGYMVTADEKEFEAMVTKEKVETLRKQAAEKKSQPSDEFEKQAYVNKIELSGRLGKDAEFTFTPSGKGICKFPLAVWQPGKDAPTMWLDCVMWLNYDETDKEHNNAEHFYQVAEYQKGKSVVVTGKLTMREYQEKRYYGITVSRAE